MILRSSRPSWGRALAAFRRNPEKNSRAPLVKGIAVFKSALELPARYEGKCDLQSMHHATKSLVSRRTFIYDHAIRKHWEIRFSSLAEDEFGRIRSPIDSSIGHTVPDAVKYIKAVHDSLVQDNPEDGASEAHCCRRVPRD